MKDLRLPIVYRSSRDLNAYVAHNYETYGRMLKDLGLKE
jgi:tripartite-type tricarboxylate transporter receptor subunit TctC